MFRFAGLFLFILTVVTGLSVSYGALAQTAMPETIARNCYTCHSVKNNPNTPLPSLKGLDAKAIQEALLDFKYERRNVTIMNRISKGLSDEQIIALGLYLTDRR